MAPTATFKLPQTTTMMPGLVQIEVRLLAPSFNRRAVLHDDDGIEDALGGATEPRDRQ